MTPKEIIVSIIILGTGIGMGYVWHDTAIPAASAHADMDENACREMMENMDDMMNGVPSGRSNVPTNEDHASHHEN